MQSKKKKLYKCHITFFKQKICWRSESDILKIQWCFLFIFCIPKNLKLWCQTSKLIFHLNFQLSFEHQDKFFPEVMKLKYVSFSQVEYFLSHNQVYYSIHQVVYWFVNPNLSSVHNVVFLSLTWIIFHFFFFLNFIT